MRHLALFLLLATALALPVGCGGSSTASGPGFLKVSVTDAPFPGDYVESASVLIEDVLVRTAAAAEGDDEEAGWTSVLAAPVEIDLVPLTGGIAEVIADVALEPGSYREVRLIVGAGEVVLSEDAHTATGDRAYNTANGTMLFPSGPQTGIKVKLDEPLEVVTELTSELMLDFSLEKNFTFNGPVEHDPGVRRVLFTPVVRATVTSTTGTLQARVLSDEGTADPLDDEPIEMATVRVLDDMMTEVASQLTGPDGVVSISVEPGIYTLEVEALGHASASAGPFEVFLVNLTDAGDITLEALTQELTGTVRDTADPPAPIEGATVTVYEGGVEVASTTTAADGTYSVILVTGSYDVTFESGGSSVTLPVNIVGTDPITQVMLDATL